MLLCTALGCQSLKGQVKEGAYHDPNGWFVCELPPRSEILDLKIEEDVLGNAVCVRFIDLYPAGDLQRVEVQLMDAAPEGQSYVDETDQTWLEAYFADLWDNGIRAAVPNAELVSTEFLPDVQGGALYVVGRFPGMNTSIRLAGEGPFGGTKPSGYDAFRGFILLYHPPYFGLVQVNFDVGWNTDTEGGLDKVEAWPAVAARLRERTIALANRVHFVR